MAGASKCLSLFIRNVATYFTVDWLISAPLGKKNNKYQDKLSGIQVNLSLVDMYCRKLLVVALKAGRYSKCSFNKDVFFKAYWAIKVFLSVCADSSHACGVKGSIDWGVLRPQSFTVGQARAERSVGELSRFSRPWFEQGRGSNSWEAEVNGTDCVTNVWQVLSPATGGLEVLVFGCVICWAVIQTVLWFFPPLFIMGGMTDTCFVSALLSVYTSTLDCLSLVASSRLSSLWLHFTATYLNSTPTYYW